MKLKITTFLLFLSLFVTAQTKFFVHAHQDDAAYFAGVPMYNSNSNPYEKSVFVVTSASDQGVRNGVDTGASKVNSTVPFFKARDYGLMKAIEFGYTDGSKPLTFNQDPRDTIVAGKKIRVWNYGSNKKAYFFDLPNGQCCSLNMGGYPANNAECIEDLRKGKISVIRNIHSTETFTWNELVLVLKSIYVGESGSTTASGMVYSTDVNMTQNPGDHADHYITSVLALESAKDLANFNSQLHTDYQLSNMSALARLSDLDLIHKISQFGAMISGIATKEYIANRHIAPQYYNWFTKESIRATTATSELSNLDENLSPPFVATDLTNPIFTKNATDLFDIKNANSNLALAINTNGTVVQETPVAGNMRQKWYLVKQSNTAYAIVNAATDQVLATPVSAVNGNGLLVATKNSSLLTKEQQFLVKLTSGTNVYSIRSAANSNLYLEISSSNTSSNFPVTVWGSNGGYNNQRWIMGVYTETPTAVTISTISNVKSGLSLSFNASNSLIQETVDATSTKQKWDIEEYLDGSIKIKNRNNDLYIETNGTSTTQNSITLKAASPIVGQKFKKVLDAASGKYILATWADNNYVLEVFGGSISPGANISVWTKHGATNQQFNLSTTTARLASSTKANEANVSIAINPVKIGDTIKVTGLKAYSQPKVALFDLSGKQVLETVAKVTEANLEISSSALTKGVYVLKVSENNLEFTQKVIME